MSDFDDVVNELQAIGTDVNYLLKNTDQIIALLQQLLAKLK